MKLTVLNVAYPFAPAGFDAVGGAEQVLAQLDHALVRAGHSSIVVACEGSAVEGTLLPTPKARGEINHAARKRIWTAHQLNIEQALADFQIDLVHFHGIDFSEYLPDQLLCRKLNRKLCRPSYPNALPGAHPISSAQYPFLPCPALRPSPRVITSASPNLPILITLHLPPHWYPKEIFDRQRPNMFLHCVSETQTAACPACAHLLPPIENGVTDHFFTTHTHAGDYALCLGRICEEKGFHIALDAAVRSETKLLLAGEVFPYSAHQEYFRSQILPRLNPGRRFIGPAGFAQKLHLLANAQCLLAPSLVPETSSLVAMEAMASGCPVVAFPSGALRNLVEHGKTGFLVNDLAQMALAINQCSDFDRHQVRARARSRFSLARTLGSYLATYHSLAANDRVTEETVFGARMSSPAEPGKFL